MLLQRIDRPRDEAGAGSERELGGRHWLVDRAHRRRWRSRARPRCRGVLTLGQPINLVVEQRHVDVDVAAQDVQRVVAADRQAVAVAGNDPDVELRIGQLDAGGDGRGATVDRMEPIGRHVIGEAGGAADTRYEHGFFPRRSNLRQRVSHAFDDRVVPAAGAPADFLVRRQIFCRQFFRRLNDSHVRTPNVRGSPLR